MSYQFVPRQQNYRSGLSSCDESEEECSVNPVQPSNEVQTKWQTLTHHGPLFAAPYERLPEGVNFYYDHKPVKLNPEAEEVATLYAKILGTRFVEHEVFNQNYFNAFKRYLNGSLRNQICNLGLCDFMEIHRYFQNQQVAKQLSSSDMADRHGHCLVDGQRHRVSLFRLDGPSLVCPSGQQTSKNMGKIRPRIWPEDVIINSDESGAPNPPRGRHWHRVIHDRSVEWLCSWVDVISGRIRYMRPHRIVQIKTPRREMIDTARRLQVRISQIRRRCRAEWPSENWLERQRAVALYFIDRLGFQVAEDSNDNQKSASICDLRVEDLKLHPQKHGKKNILELQRNDLKKLFVVQPEIYFNLNHFVAGKNPKEFVFELLYPSIIYEHLERLMDRLTPKTFWIYNTSNRLEARLKELSVDVSPEGHLRHYHKVLEEILNYFNKCDGKTLSFSLSSLNINLFGNRTRGTKRSHSFPINARSNVEMASVVIRKRSSSFLEKKRHYVMESTFPYLDPRITIAWCLKRKIPISDIYPSSMRKKIKWALDITTEDFRF